eukprot:1465392-Amphidinium_carterae.1
MGPNYSQDLAAKIDDAIHDISEDCYLRALSLVMENRACLDKITEELVEVETMSGDRLREIVAEFTEVPEKEEFGTPNALFQDTGDEVLT